MSAARTYEGVQGGASQASFWKQLGRVCLTGGAVLPGVHQLLRTLARAGLLPAPVWKRLPVDREFLLRLPSGTAFRYAATPRDSLGRALYWRGLCSWERETLTVFQQLVPRARYFLDAGANTGVFSLLACASNPNLRGIAFEPVPRIFELLRKNIRINHFCDRCEARAIAVSDTVGKTRLHVPFGELPTSASLHPQGFRGYPGELIDIETTTIDAVCIPDFPADLVKIDVEGFEDKVLVEMTRTLTECRPVLIVECNPDGPIAEVQRILTEHEYRCMHLRSAGPVPTPQITPDPFETHRNYLFVPKGGALGLTLPKATGIPGIS